MRNPGPADRLEQLRAEQLRAHRIEPPCPLRDPEEVADFVRERGVVAVSGRSSLPVLVVAIAGRSIEGTWWRDPESHRIYELLGRLPDGLIGGRFVAGKTALCGAELGPAIERVASDPGRRGQTEGALPDLARRLLEDVERSGTVRMDAWGGVPAKRSRPARKRLERDLLVVSEQFHTDRGYHTALIRPWTDGDIAKRFGEAAPDLELEEAQEALVLAGVRSAVVALEREVRRWFALGREPVDRLADEGRLVVIPDGRRRFLTAAS